MSSVVSNETRTLLQNAGSVAIPLSSGQSVVVWGAELTADPQRVTELLAQELAPVSAWLDVALLYYRCVSYHLNHFS
jgi:hypothetical protein